MEIERKYLLTEAQLNSLISSTDNFVLETRYYLYCENDNEIRVTKRAEEPTPTFTLDRMQIIHEDTDEYYVRSKERLEITETEFTAMVEQLKGQAPVERLHFMLNESTELKVYQGRHKGLIRAEVEFSDINEANNYQPDFENAGEITNTALGRDVLLAHLTQEEVADLIAQTQAV